MIARFFLALFVFAVPSAFGQISMYGPITTHLKAGDVAPDIVFTKVPTAPDGVQWSAADLTGRLSILVFSPRPSQNPQIVTEWNRLVDEFADKPVQFLFVSGERESTLLPWLNQHPIKGWVFHDPDGKTGNAYGLEQPATIFIGTDGKILGFAFGGFPPEVEEVKAALEGRITTTQPTPGTMKAFLASHQVVLNAEPFRFPSADEYKPKFPPSYELHISPSQSEAGVNSSGPDFKVLRHYTLKEAISNVYFDGAEVNSNRISLPASLDNSKRYDFSLVLPGTEDQEQIKTRMQQGIEDYFHLTARREDRVVDVYVVTATPGYTLPAVQPTSDDTRPGGDFGGGGIEFKGDPTDDSGTMKPVGLTAVRSASYSGTVDGFCRMLDGSLDRPVINETDWDSKTEIRVDTGRGEANTFLERLRQRSGLDITPEQRSIETLVFDSR
jgi:uncharacterized protein (TIGR03435 family)